MSHCVITGSALATPQGVDARTMWQNLLAGAILRGTGHVPLERDHRHSRVSQLAIHVARDAIAEAGWSSAILADERTALIIGTSKGPIEAWLQASPPTEGPSGEIPAFGLAAVAADVAGDIGHGFGPRLTSSAACASGLHALIRAKQLLDTGRCDRALIVAAESATSALFEATFRRLGVLARSEIGCRPFDVEREGFLLAEAAAAICLERSDARGLAVQATSLRGDATHLTGLDPTGTSLAAALRAVAGEEKIDLVHAHGTGTELNDPIELAAIESVAGGAVVVSHKHAIGHTQGAAGLIGVALNVMAHRHGEIFGNANSPQPLRAAVEISAMPIRRPIRSSIVLAAGFGGPLAAVRLDSVG